MEQDRVSYLRNPYPYFIDGQPVSSVNSRVPPGNSDDCSLLPFRHTFIVIGYTRRYRLSAALGGDNVDN